MNLTVSGFIRQDVVFQPGSVSLGEVYAGSQAEQAVTVKYAGRDDWQVIDVLKPDEFFDIQVQEAARGNGRVEYSMSVRLTGDAPAGYINDELFLVTNDQTLEKIPLSVTGRVIPSVTVSPASLALGVLQPGERVTKQIIVRAQKPFQVTDVHCDGNCLSFKSPRGAKKLHFIPVTFTAGDEPNNLAMTINIKTDLGQGAIATCLATASVRAPAE